MKNAKKKMQMATEFIAITLIHYFLASTICTCSSSSLSFHCSHFVEFVIYSSLRMFAVIAAQTVVNVR